MKSSDRASIVVNRLQVSKWPVTAGGRAFESLVGVGWPRGLPGLCSRSPSPSGLREGAVEKADDAALVLLGLRRDAGDVLPVGDLPDLLRLPGCREEALVRPFLRSTLAVLAVSTFCSSSSSVLAASNSPAAPLTPPESGSRSKRVSLSGRSRSSRHVSGS